MLRCLPVVLLACTPEPLSITLSPVADAEACATVSLKGTLTGEVAAVSWSVVDRPLLVPEPQGLGIAELVLPAVSRSTDLVVEVTATDSNGASARSTATVHVTALSQDPSLPAGMAAGCDAFPYGVASGDPEPGSVLIWAAVLPGDGSDRSVAWEMATEPLFAEVVASGTATASETAGHTVEVEVDGLEAATTYWYRFTADGRRSPLGRTRTAPSGPVDRLTMLVASCSSIYSGWFNAYARMAEREDVDLVVHLGDYIYDFVDAEEEVRVPEPYPEVPRGLEEGRDRHRYYLTDPDLRRARAAHPWAVMWDNHDWDDAGGIDAFREWVPMREPEADRPDIAYRTLRYGDLVDLVLLDVTSFRNREKVPGTDENSIVGDAQWAWLEDTMTTSTATWRVIGSQKMLATVAVNGALSPTGEYVFDSGTWDGYPADRARMFDLMAGGNHLVLSGDSHISVAMDVVDDPANEESPYDQATGEGSLGVELLPTSITRGNFDETLGQDGAEVIVAGIAAAMRNRNPHEAYLELTRHGYGVVSFTAQQLEASIWYSEILAPADEEEEGVALTCDLGANRWEVVRVAQE